MSVDDAARAGSRASDADRDRAISCLRTHYTQGRLTLDEFLERVDEVNNARTALSIDHALRELPPQPLNRRMSPRGWRRLTPPGWWLQVNLICLAVWAVTCIGSGLYYFWPMWVLLGTSIPVLLHAAQCDRSPDSPRLAAPPADEAARDLDPARRVLTSVLFIDVVESTDHAAEMGDAAWDEVLREYEARIRDAVATHHGHEVFSKGDEMVAAFATPAAAVRCGQRITGCAHALGLEVRAGVHAGEMVQQGQSMRGLAMHIGQRVCAAAGPGQVLVSSTVRDLLVGSRLDFCDVGEHNLKGVPGSWRLFALAY